MKTSTDIFCLEQVTKIDQHGGFVKGVTWDPAGKFLASQVDMTNYWDRILD